MKIELELTEAQLDAYEQLSIDIATDFSARANDVLNAWREKQFQEVSSNLKVLDPAERNALTADIKRRADEKGAL